MSVKKASPGKIIDRQTGGTFFDVRQVSTYEGHDKERKLVKTTILLFHAKHRVKGQPEKGFKNKDLATIFALEHAHKYNKKIHKFL